MQLVGLFVYQCESIALFVYRMTFENFTESVKIIIYAVTIFKLDYAPRGLFLQDFGENKPTIYTSGQFCYIHTNIHACT